MRRVAFFVLITVVAAVSALIPLGAQRRDQGVAVSPLDRLWSQPLPFGEAVRLVVSDTRLLLVFDRRLDAVAWSSGAPAWTVAITATTLPVPGDGAVFIAADDQIVALSELNGRVLWRLPAGAITAPMVYRSGWLLALNHEGLLRGIRAADGAVVWTTRSPAGSLAAPLTVDGDGVFAVSTDGRVTAWRVTDGALRWTAAGVGAPERVLAAHGRVYLAAGGRLTAYAQTTGRVAWSFGTDLPAVSQLAVDAWHVYHAALDNSVRAHEAARGSLQWNRKLDARIVEGLTTDGGVVLVPLSTGAVQLLLASTGRRAGQLPSPSADARGTTTLSTAGAGAGLRLARLTVADTVRTIDALGRVALPVVPATSLSGVPLPWPPPGLRRP